MAPSTQDKFDFSYLPDQDVVLEWAKGIVARQGDAFVGWPYVDGLYVAGERTIIGRALRVVRENVARWPADGTTNVARSIQVSTYPDDTFAEPFWRYPDRTPQDVPVRLGSRRYNEIYVPEPGTAMPIVVRVVMWRNYVAENPEGQRIDVEVVEYSLHPTYEATLQTRAAQADAARAAQGDKLSLESLERRRTLLAARQQA